ncbi:hypothetical protein C8R43DRAFT_959773 [Mycena crocata]|nr:hypothetical protein C8R43DRAFT_959773 [Mycena crocata]
MQRPVEVDITEVYCRFLFENATFLDGVLFQTDTEKPLRVRVPLSSRPGELDSAVSSPWLECGQKAFSLDHKSVAMTISEGPTQANSTTMTVFFEDQNGRGTYRANRAITHSFRMNGKDNVWKGNVLVVAGEIETGFRSVAEGEMSVVRDCMNWSENRTFIASDTNAGTKKSSGMRSSDRFSRVAEHSVVFAVVDYMQMMGLSFPTKGMVFVDVRLVFMMGLSLPTEGILFAGSIISTVRDLDKRGNWAPQRRWDPLWPRYRKTFDAELCTLEELATAIESTERV